MELYLTWFWSYCKYTCSVDSRGRTWLTIPHFGTSKSSCFIIVVIYFVGYCGQVMASTQASLPPLTSWIHAWILTIYQLIYQFNLFSWPFPNNLDMMFYLQGVLDRFTQIKPKIIFSVNAVRYNNKIHDHMGKLTKVVEGKSFIKGKWAMYVLPWYLIQ